MKDDGDSTADRDDAMESELRNLLRRGAPRIEVDRATQQRVFGRLSAVLPLGSGGLGQGGGQGGAASPSYASPTTTGTKIAAISTASSTKLMATIALGLIVGIGLAAGVARGVAVETSGTPPSSASSNVSVDPIEAAGAPVPKPAEIDDSNVPAPLAVAPPTPRASSGPKRSPLASSSAERRNAERPLLDKARMAFARGAFQESLRALGEHERRHPNGSLSEERDALRIRTLASLGRSTEAGELGRRFQHSHPTSLMLPAVEAALDGGTD